MMLRRPLLYTLPVLAALLQAVQVPAQEFGEVRGRPATPYLAAHRPPVPGPNGLVTSGHPLASMAGLQMLMRGGNAADASVAVLATLHVVRPQMSGIGGNGFMTIYDRQTDRVYSLGATGAAPRALDVSSLTPAQLDFGIKAGVVPGLFGGWIEMLERFGTMSLAEVLQPAIDYADKGHPLEASVAQAIRSNEARFRQVPSTARVFLPEGRVPVAGELFRMPDLANTLRRLVEAEETALAQGKSRSDALRAAFDRFYKGDLAREMADFYQANGGDFDYEDFAGYRPVWDEPVQTSYRGYDVYSSPSTSRGGYEVVMQLNLVEPYELKRFGHNSPQALHRVIEAIKVAKSDVYRYVADPKVVTVPAERLTSKEYAGERRALIDEERAIAFPSPGQIPVAARQGAPSGARQLPEVSWDGSTTDFSVADRFGNVIAGTPTHGGLFGTGVVVGSTGILFNNGTRVGSTAPYPDHINYPRGGQIPILNNSPTLVLRDGRFILAIASPGGETIGQTQFQVLLNVLEFGMGIQEAIEAPRVVLDAEPNFYRAGSEITVQAESRIAPEVLQALERMGHSLRAVPGFSLGSNSGIHFDPTTGAMLAGADPRRTDYAVGY
jgi:gamma-glutamyltranspeptidase / glutathione hydrolase